MKKLIWLIPISFLLAGCGGSTTVADTPVKSEPDVASYLSAIRADGGILGVYATDDELIKLGASACSEFEQGANIIDLAQSVPVNNEEERVFVASQIAASLAFLCPEYTDTAQS